MMEYFFSRFGNLNRSFKKLHKTIYLKCEVFWVSLKQPFLRSVAQTAIFVMNIYKLYEYIQAMNIYNTIFHGEWVLCIFSFIISFIFLFRYHSNACYKSYLLPAETQKQNETKKILKLM